MILTLSSDPTLKRLIVWSTMSSWLVEGAGPLAVPLLVCLRGITAMFPMDFPGDSRVEWKEGMAEGEGRREFPDNSRV